MISAEFYILFKNWTCQREAKFHQIGILISMRFIGSTQLVFQAHWNVLGLGMDDQMLPAQTILSGVNTYLITTRDLKLELILYSYQTTADLANLSGFEFG